MQAQITLLAPDAQGRAIWLAVDSAVAHFAPDGDSRIAFAALGLCMGFPLAGLDLLSYGESVLRAVGPRMSPDAIGAASLAAMDLLHGRSAPAPAPVATAPHPVVDLDDAPPNATIDDLALMARAQVAPDRHGEAWAKRRAELLAGA